jgi:hypothetical protein
MKNKTSNENKSISFFNMEEFKSPNISEHRHSVSNATMRELNNQFKKQDSFHNIYSDFIYRFTNCKSDFIQSHIEPETIEEEHNISESMKSERIVMADRIFWTKEKMLSVRGKLKTLKNKIHEKTRNDFNSLNTYIDMSEDEKVM